MNALFGAGVVILPLLMLAVLIVVAFKTKTLIAWWGLAVWAVFIVVLFNSIQAYGPRNDLGHTKIPNATGKILRVIPNNDFLAPQNKWDELDEAIDELDDRQRRDAKVGFPD